MASAARDRTFDLFAARRMVVDVPCGDGSWLAEFVTARPHVPAVGLERSRDRVSIARARGLPAVFAGSWHALRRRPESFDGVRATLAKRDDSDGLAAVAASLLPGGVVAFVPPELPDRDDLEAVGLHERLRDPSLVVATTAPPAPRSPWPAPVVGPYADLFAGRERVLEIGCGSGRFLDALHVRGVGGICALDGASRLRSLRLRAHAEIFDVASEDARDRIVEGRSRWNGVYADRILDRLQPHDVEPFCALVRRVLGPEGVCILRGPRGSDRWSAFDALADGAGLGAIRGRFERDATDEYRVVRIADPNPALDRDSAECARVLAALESPADRPVDRPPGSIEDLERFESRVHSQCGDDGVIERVFACLGVRDRSYVEFGCGDGSECNTARLREEEGWTGLLMDGVVPEGHALVRKEWIRPDNIVELFARHGVPPEFDLMSIDLDGNDYWVWNALDGYRPRVVVAEYNANFGPDRAVTIPEDPAHVWDGTDHYGASLAALDRLARRKGYTLVYCNRAGVNAVFVRDDELPAGFARRPVEDVYEPPNYFYRGYRQVPHLGRDLVEVSG